MIERVEESPRILMINSTRGIVGGVERMLVQMANTLRQENWQVYGLFEHTAHIDPVFDAAFDDFDVIESSDISENIDYYIEIGISVVCIHKTNRLHWVKTLQALFPTVVIVHDHDYYCLRRHKYFPIKRKNCYLPFSPIYCPLCAGLIKRGDNGMEFIDVKNRYLLLKQIRACKISFVLSDYMRTNLLKNGWKANSIHTLIPFQDVPDQTAVFPSPIHDRIPVILYVGQIIRGKGIDLLLKALALIEEPYLCQIVGRGNDEHYLKTLVQKLGIEKKVKFLGWASDVSSSYELADIVVVPSRWQEPFGLVGLEAFAHHKPVIAFDIGGISQWLKHKVNGILVRPNNIRRLAGALKSLIKDPVLREKYAIAGFEMIVNDYSFVKYKDSLVQPLYKLIR